MVIELEEKVQAPGTYIPKVHHGKYRDDGRLIALCGYEGTTLVPYDTAISCEECLIKWNSIRGD